jgi:hypothetical protein
MPRTSRSEQVPDNDQPRRNADAGLKRYARLQGTYRCDQFEPCPDRPLGIVLMGLRIAKVHEDAVAQILCHEPIEAVHNLGDAFVIGRNNLAQVLWVHAGGERRRTDKVREHHRDLLALRGVCGWASGRDGRCETGRLCTQSKRTNGFQELETSTTRKTHLAKMILREIVQDVGVDRILAEYRLVLCEAKAPQPTSEVHDGNSA